MAYTPKYGTKLSPEQTKELFATRKQIADTTNASPKQRSSFVTKAANAITDFIGARGIAEQYGSSLARTGLRLTGRGDAAQYVDNPSLKEVTGSAIQSAANLTPAGAGRSLATRVGLGALAGQAIDTGSDLQSGKSVTESIKPGPEAAIGANIPLAGAGFRGLGSLFGKAGDKIQFSTIKPSQADIKDGFKIETVKKYNLGGSIKRSLDKTEAKMNELSQQLNQKLQDSTNAVDLTKVYDRSVKKLLGNKLDNFGANTRIDTALDQLRSELTSISGNNGLVSVPEANQVKRASGAFGAWQFGKPDPDANALEKVYSTFYREMKNEIEKQSPDGVSEINQQLSELIPVMNAIIRRIPVAERNNLLSLGDVITLSQAAVNPSVGFLTLANVASKSGAFGNALSRGGEAVAGSAARTAPVESTVYKTINQATNN